MFRVSVMARMAPSLMLLNKGKVVSWLNGRGFGFIEDDADKKQHFVHFSALQTEAGGFRALSVGQEVEFEVTTQDGRSRADNVTAPGGGKLPSGPRPAEGGGFGGGGGGGGGGGRGFGNGGGGGRGGGGGGGGYGDGNRRGPRRDNYGGNRGEGGGRARNEEGGGGGGGGRGNNDGGYGGNFSDEF